jgi:hypothetical protein
MARHARTGEDLFDCLRIATEVRIQVRFRTANHWFKVTKTTAKEILQNAGIKPESVAGAVPFGSLEDFEKRDWEDYILYLNNEER